MDDDWQTATAVLGLAAQLVDGIQDGLTERGFDDVRPAHGFVFARISEGGATTADVAERLGVTKQAASQLVAQLVQRGYVQRSAHPDDGRARLLVLTPRGVACTAAAREAAAATVSAWRGALTREASTALGVALQTLAAPGPLRPGW